MRLFASILNGVLRLVYVAYTQSMPVEARDPCVTLHWSITLRTVLNLIAAMPSYRGQGNVRFRRVMSRPSREQTIIYVARHYTGHIIK